MERKNILSNQTQYKVTENMEQTSEIFLFNSVLEEKQKLFGAALDSFCIPDIFC